MRFALFVLLRFAVPFGVLAPLAARAQAPGTCERGTAQTWLDANEVRAAVFNTGALFFGNTTTDGTGYLVPKATGLAPLFAAGLWVGGQVDGELRVAGARYTRFDTWPGPLRDGGALPNPTDCSAYDRIYLVSRADVRRYLETGVLTDDLRDWPYDLGAPVLDGDGIDGNYDLEGGDQPALYGDQTAWWVMNDVGNVHEETESDPLGIEVQVSAFAVASGIRALQQATYYRYRIINRNSRSLDSAYVALWMDPDLGEATDDYVGSDTTLSMGFVYNGDDFDDPSTNGYGVPSAHGYQVVQGPVGLPNGRDDDGDGAVDEPDERLGMTAMSCIGKNWSLELSDPRTASEYYHCMQGVWKHGTPVTASGNGYETEGPITTFVFPGDPVTDACWSMVNDCEGGSGSPNDMRLVVASGPFRLGPGEETEVVFGLPFAWGRDHLDSVTLLRSAAYSVQAAWESGVVAPVRVEAGPPPEGPHAIEITRPSPNPFTDHLSLSYTLPEALEVRVAVLDVLGREVALLASAEQSAGPHAVEWNAADLPAGTYLVRFEAAGESRTFPVTKRR